MNISVKFIGFNNSDVIATSDVASTCPASFASLPVVKYTYNEGYFWFNYSSDRTYPYKNSSYSNYYYLYDANGNAVNHDTDYTQLGLVENSKYHVGYSDGVYSFYLCSSDHDLTGNDPFNH